MVNKIFISYSSVNEDVAKNICEYMENNGKSCFFAPRDIQPGANYAEKLVEAIDGSEALILILSKASNESQHVLREIERAASRKLPIYIYKIEEVQLSKAMEYFIMLHQWTNSDEEFSDSMKKILAAMDNETIPAAPVNNHKYDTEEKDKSKVPEIIAFALIVAIVAALAIFFINKNNKTKDKEEETTTIEAVTSTAATEAPTTEVATSEIATTETATTEATTTAQEEATTAAPNKTAYELGDTVTFGKYLDKDIEWDIIKIDGNEAVLIATKILCMKALDSAECGTFGRKIVDGEIVSYYQNENREAALKDTALQKEVWGDNDWATSNLKVWLNSSDKSVTYVEDQAPINAACSDNFGYSDQDGFLSGFSKEELAALVDNGEIGSVFILSEDELQWLNDSGAAIFVGMTEEALELPNSKLYNTYLYGEFYNTYIWWLRDAVAGSGSLNKVVYVEDKKLNDKYTEHQYIFEYDAGVDGVGVRPAIKVDLTKLK